MKRGVPISHNPAGDILTFILNTSLKAHKICKMIHVVSMLAFFFFNVYRVSHRNAYFKWNSLIFT